MSSQDAKSDTSILKSGMLKSLTSLMIKVVTAGLAYLMFVVLARAMDEVSYGQFASGFSLATMLAIGAAMGQQTAVLRFWPEEDVAGNRDKALNAIQSGWALLILASVALALLLVLFALIFGLVSSDGLSMVTLFASALLIFPLAAAEFGSSVLRAQGSVWTALMPRDIIWRILVPGSVWFLFLVNIKLDGAAALLLTAVLLVLVVGLQVVMGRRRGYQIEVSFSGLRSYWQERGKASRWFLAGTVTDSAALNIDIVLVGLFVAEAAAGLYFNAFRTAGLMTLFMFAIQLVVAPMVSRHFHSGQLRQAQLVTTFNAWAGFVFSLGVFAIFWFYGDLILSLFGESYAQGQMILIILSAGLLMDAATGPTRIVMMMTGHERDYVRIFGIIMAIGMALQLIVIPLYGLLGAALLNAVSRIVAQTAIAIWSRKHIGIDTSLLGLWDLTSGRYSTK